MTMRSMAVLLLCSASALMRAQTADTPRWMQRFTGEEVNGDHVIACWQFEPGHETEDNSGNGHTLRLRGPSVFSEDGRFGSCLESFVAGTANDVAMGAAANDHDALSPEGAFSLELWLKPKPELNEVSTAFLVDKKYFHYAKDLPEANTDYCLYLQRLGTDEFQIIASLGFGTDSVWGRSARVTLTPGTWFHIGFSYNGAGISRFFLNGKAVGRALHEGRGALTPGRHALVIGDRVGSTYHGCPAYIDQVRLCRGVLPQFAGTLTAGITAGRTVFRRMETDATVDVTVANDAPGPVTDVVVDITFGADRHRETMGTLAPQEVRTIALRVDTRLKSGAYPLTVSARGRSGERAFEPRTELVVHIVPRPRPDEMPVVMWGSGDIERLEYVGFTHALQHLVNYAKVWDAGEPTECLDSSAVAARAAMLNTYLARGMQACAYLYPGRWVARNDELKHYLRVDRSGNPYPHSNVSASHPDIQNFAYNVGASVARTFGGFPALGASLIHSEIRDGTEISFHDFERTAARDALGFPMPPMAVSKSGVSYTTLPDFPVDRVIPDDHPLLQFYSWFWKDGDGWNPLHTQVHKGLKSSGRDDLWTFFDPAVRVPSVWGSGGGVDVLSQWTYSYPDPIKIGQATDELFAMADGRREQQVMKMTQIIWYRSQTAPDLPEDEADRAPWENDLPDARFVTIAPDHLREAFWSKLSRPIRGIMYHGWGSLFEAPHGSYRYTNPETKEVLRELVNDVVRPLGPTLLNVPDRPADVAVLESFASQVFANRGTRGWSGSWEARMHLILQWSALQPRVIYDEHVLRDGLGQYKVLVMPACDVLTESVVAAVHTFQRRGGIVVGDEFLCPAISPDIVLKSCGDRGEAHERKHDMLTAAAQLREELDPFYERYADSSNPEVIPRVRSTGKADYLFALNDHRTYGDYIGHHRRVMEKGLASGATLSIRRGNGAVYDLVTSRRIPVARTDDGIAIDVSFGPGQGRLFMITDRPIAAVTCNAPSQVRRGQALTLDIRVKSGLIRTVQALVPVRLTVTDAAGKEAEGTGFYAAEDGRLSVTLDIAPNDEPGEWRVTVRELASGKETTVRFTVQ